MWTLWYVPSPCVPVCAAWGNTHAGVIMMSAAGFRQREASCRARLHEFGPHGDERPPVLLHFRCFHLGNVVEPLPAVHAEQVAAHAERLAQRIRHHSVACMVAAGCETCDIFCSDFKMSITYSGLEACQSKHAAALEQARKWPLGRTRNIHNVCSQPRVGGFEQ